MQLISLEAYLSLGTTSDASKRNNLLFQAILSTHTHTLMFSSRLEAVKKVDKLEDPCNILLSSINEELRKQHVTFSD